MKSKGRQALTANILNYFAAEAKYPGVSIDNRLMAFISLITVFEYRREIRLEVSFRQFYVPFSQGFQMLKLKSKKLGILVESIGGSGRNLPRWWRMNVIDEAFLLLVATSMLMAGAGKALDPPGIIGRDSAIS